MSPTRFEALIAGFRTLRIGVVGDFSLDRYFDIDPTLVEKSIETGLPVHNVTRVRCQPGAAGNIVQNLAAFGPAALWPVGYCGDDGEGFELRRALGRLDGVHLDHFAQTPDRLTFTYSKPLLHRRDQPPEELARLDMKNWTPTPAATERALIASLHDLAPRLDALIVMDQAAAPGIGAVSGGMLSALAEIASARPSLVIAADSRRGLAPYPPVIFKMNASEFFLTGGRQSDPPALLECVREGATELALRNGHPVFITLAERGMIGAAPGMPALHLPALPVQGAIDTVGAGDTVTGVLTLALAGGATLQEAMELAQAAASVVIHQLGTTGTATAPELHRKLFP